MISPVNATDRIGDRLVQAGILTPEQAVKVTELQLAEGLRFGEAAVKLNFTTEQEVRRVLSKQFHYAIAPAGQRGGISQTLSIAHQPFGSEAEAIRQLRTELSIRLRDRPRIDIAVVSPNKGEGRSYLAASLAIAFSQAGQRTLFINADMRDGQQQPLFDAEKTVGLSSILADRSPALPGMPIAHFPLLHVIGSGPQPPNPIEILQESALRNLIDSFDPGFEVCIVDTPAARLSSDTQVIAQQIGTCLLVGRKNVTPLKDLQYTRDLLDMTGAQVVGTVYNQFGGRPRRGWWPKRGVQA